MANRLLNDSVLVENVRKYPWVYDTSDYRFKNASTRQDAWRRIGQEVNMTASQSQHRFLVIRNRYGKEKRKLSILKKPLISAWPLFKEMRFIDPYMKYRKKEIEANTYCSADSLQELIMTCDAAVDEKPDFLLSPSSSSAEVQPIINHTNNISPTLQNTQAMINPIVTGAPERPEPNPAVSAITNQLTDTIQKVAHFITEQKSTRIPASNHDELQSFGRTIALMLTGIKDKRRQRRAMADLLMKMSEYDSDDCDS